MPNVANGDRFNVQFVCRFGDQIAINTFEYQVASLVGNISDQLCINAVEQQVGGHVKACISEKAEYRGCIGQLIGTLNKYQRVYSTINQGDGSRMGDPLPKQVAGIFTRRSIFAGRHAQGRVYVPFPAESDNDPDEGRPNLGYLAALGTYSADAYTSVPVVLGGDSCALNPGHWVIPKPPGVPFWLNYVSAQTRDYWATQRRRGDFGPKNISPL